jgi:Aromatic acid exporter family member 1
LRVRVDRIWWRLRTVARTTIAQAETRLRTRGRSALFRAARMTGATVAALVVAELVGLREPPPLIAVLTALLVQATLASTLVNGIQRVFSVVAGVALAVLFVWVVGLTWSLGARWSRPRSWSVNCSAWARTSWRCQLSAMLVLGVGHAGGAESIGAGRVVETLVGAVVGVLINVAFLPAARTGHVSGAVAAFADEIAALPEAAADALGRGTSSRQAPPCGPRWHPPIRPARRPWPRTARIARIVPTARTPVTRSPIADSGAQRLP